MSFEVVMALVVGIKRPPQAAWGWVGAIAGSALVGWYYWSGSAPPTCSIIAGDAFLCSDAGALIMARGIALGFSAGALLGGGIDLAIEEYGLWQLGRK